MERYMECPYCRGLSFLGEWQTPKELQSVDVKTCDNCNKDVSTAFLVQPKEKKRVEEFLLKRLLEEAEKRRLAIYEANNNNGDDDTFSQAGNTDESGASSFDLRPNSVSTHSADGRGKRGVERQRSTNGDRAKSATSNKGTVRMNVPGSEKRSRIHSNRSSENLIQEEHILVTLTEQNNE